MRLLNATSQPLQFEVFYGDQPPYAILSHTWGNRDEEVTFQDLRDGNGVDKPGLRKIKACCDQAVRDGLRYVWIDTCCIDKTNSVELQEAINSMFTWYKDSAVCYAYLSDYGDRDRSVFDVEEFKASKWFTRGWTLQEFIAPSKVVFYGRDWKSLGDRTELCDLISKTTRINREVLSGQDLEKSSIAQRMSWASMRTTTRVEDIAYCLLGIFGVHMPMIYGEGGIQAFIRLQKQIMEESDDQSLFAWKQDGGFQGHGLLATSPALFAESSSVVRRGYAKSKSAHKMTNRGLEIQLPLTCGPSGGDQLATLDCIDVDDDSNIGIYVTLYEDGRFIRTRLDQLARTPRSHWWPLAHNKFPVSETLHIPQVYLRENPTQKDFHFHVMLGPTPIIRNVGYDVPNLTKSKTFTLCIRSMPDTFQSGRKPSAINRYFTITNTTSAGRTAHKENLDYRLGVGGRAGILLSPLNNFRTFLKSWTSSMFIKSDAVMAIFGVNFESSLFVKLVKVDEVYGESCKGDKSGFFFGVCSLGSRTLPRKV